MNPVGLFTAAGALVAAVTVGTAAHELSHAATLRALGVPCEVTWLPGDDRAGLAWSALLGRWATVTPRGLRPGLAPWRLRAAAMAPLALVLPVGLAAAGVLPDPMTTGGLPPKLAVVGWLATAIPSPQDFSVLWYAERALPGAADGAPPS